MMSEVEREKWDARYRDPGLPIHEPSPFILSLDTLLPRKGRALDVAGGTGRHAIWLGQRGLEVTLADISPVGLERAEREASRAGTRLRTLAIDFERDEFPAGPWELIISFHYLYRPLFEHYPRVLAPGGSLVVVHPTRSNLLRHKKPGAEFLLDDAELPQRVSGLQTVRYEEGWLDEARHEARLVARKPE